MKLLLKNRILDLLARCLMWLALHCECWRFGHQWRCGPKRAWCEHCEAEINSDRAIRKFGERCIPEPQPPRKPWPPMIVDPSMPHDQITFVSLSNFRRLRDDSIVKLNPDGTLGETVVPAFPVVPQVHLVEEGGPILSQEQWDLMLGNWQRGE